MIYDISANDSIIYLGSSKGLRVINYKNNNPVEITSLLNYTGVVACFQKNSTLFIDMWDSLYIVPKNLKWVLPQSHQSTKKYKVKTILCHQYLSFLGEQKF